MALARGIMRRGRAAMVLALDPAARRLAVAISFDRCPCLTLEITNPEEEALASLMRLAAGSDGGPYEYAARAAEALSAEPVSRRFFRQFRATLDKMTGGISGRVPPDDGHALTLLQLTRVLFLYFIQAKGWLAGQDRFLAQQVDRCLRTGRRIQRDLLRPLFFGTLNQPACARSRTVRQFGSIPFLNGGLFEPHRLERRYPADIPNHLWRDAFDGLFERFHFTVSEGGKSGSVAPDMLGRVFEGVMAPASRKASGAFYTPSALVDQLLEAGLIAFLTTRLRCAESSAERRLTDPDPAVTQALAAITVLDPAAGSGAFLLRALERLSACGSPGTSVAERKRHVLRHNLFGVDSNASAVRLTELRLWLAVIADDPADRPEQVTPLPNLDCLIRQGDSLFEPGGLYRNKPAQPDIEQAAELAALRQEVISATGHRKQVLVRRLRQCEAHALECSLTAAEATTQSVVAECFEQARAHDLFGRSRGLDRELREQLQRLRRSLQELRQARRRLRRDGEVPWFHYQSHFADVFAGGGFDLVIGNPPWLRSELIPHTVRLRLAGRYRWWRAGGRCYGNSPDLAVAFVERALELARPGGVVALLVPAKIASAGYGATARHALATSTALHVIADLTGNPTAVFDATVYPLALVTAKTPPDRHHRLRTTFSLQQGKRMVQSDLAGGAPWILIGSGLTRLLSRLGRDHPSLGESITCHLGVKTGLNRVFLDPPADLEPEVLRWAIRGRDVSPFRFHCKHRLLWSHDSAGFPSTRLPPKAAAYLRSHEAALRARQDYQTGPPWTVFRVRPAVARYRVIWPDLARRLMAVSLTSRPELDCIPLNSCYVAPMSRSADADALGAWLNSSWITAIARLGAVPASGGFARFNAQVVARLPLPSSVLVDAELSGLPRLARTGAQVQDELDKLAAKHLRLSSSAQRALRAVLANRSGNRR
ncbi:MAG TPA: N-6 DNA methylase [Gemmatimonadales bacterium]|nr:N-6 DNA methylase [Gemmatimonadales bacterium]